MANGAVPCDGADLGGWTAAGPPRWWDLAGGASGRPAQLMRADLLEAGMGSPDQCVSMEARFVAGGLGDDGVGSDGASLLVWSDGRWKQVAGNTAPAASPEALRWASAAPSARSTSPPPSRVPGAA